MVERVMRLNEQELNIIELGLKNIKEDIEKIINDFYNRPPICNPKYLNENGETAYEAGYKDVLEQAKALLKRIEEAR